MARPLCWSLRTWSASFSIIFFQFRFIIKENNLHSGDMKIMSGCCFSSTSQNSLRSFALKKSQPSDRSKELGLVTEMPVRSASAVMRRGLKSSQTFQDLPMANIARPPRGSSDELVMMDEGDENNLDDICSFILSFSYSFSCSFSCSCFLPVLGLAGSLAVCCRSKAFPVVGLAGSLAVCSS